MNELAGTSLNKLPFEDIRKVADLSYFDGPLLSLFNNFRGQSYIFYWCDSDDSYNRWLVFQISDEQLAAYIRQDVTLYEVITQPQDGRTYVVDIDGQGNYSSITLTQPQKLPDDYKPKSGTYYDSSSTVFYEQDIAVEFVAMLLKKIQQLKIRKPLYTKHFYQPENSSELPQEVEDFQPQ